MYLYTIIALKKYTMMGWFFSRYSKSLSILKQILKQPAHLKTVLEIVYSAIELYNLIRGPELKELFDSAGINLQGWSLITINFITIEHVRKNVEKHSPIID